MGALMPRSANFGPVERIKETCREQRGVTWLEGLFQDARFAVRQLRKTPASPPSLC